VATQCGSFQHSGSVVTHGKEAENSIHKQLSFRFVVVYDILKIT
jgi:hypothetical protein